MELFFKTLFSGIKEGAIAAWLRLEMVSLYHGHRSRCVPDYQGSKETPIILTQSEAQREYKKLRVSVRERKNQSEIFGGL